ncbi:riboflavin synthase [Antarcticibacterium sp. 1MA-6-2]|uniref:riboflavin synthase n=1 Tax=Antarcticibacterium sp. 1MA-6-2 TaxID=2908210 RepID=UPI001F477DD3|nr:riboflavin synthase [Antarcticibacterium sp. 1MA-6-2]UJH90062.1 riboflavin synthase [Antarcticibacterium sp. 1MA-6-2]
MFTGIVEELGEVIKLVGEKGNLHITVAARMTPELKIDQSVAHNGVCLTVVNVEGQSYTVTAINETLEKTNLGMLKEGDLVNLERGMQLGARLDGHIVQGHVDQIGICKSVRQEEGSWIYTFEYDPTRNNITIEKGSITVNGVSLTVINSKKSEFSVAIIPYTYDNTSFQNLREGATVNLEFDVIGKYVKRLTELK